MKSSFHTRRFVRWLGGFALALTTLGCATAPQEASWPPTAKKWFDRADYSYQHGDLDDASMSVDNALAELPGEIAVRLLSARIDMARLDFDSALQVLEAAPGTEAAGLRARCHWYRGDLEQTASQLELVLADPDVKDGWARNTLALARSGRGRRPFEVSGGLLAAVEMPRAGGTTMFVPVEVDGEPSLAVIATDRVETVIDGKGTDWVSLRFGARIEVGDVPVVGQDLSGLSREIGAPVKLLIGVHLLRKLRATIDVSGQQFVVRSFDPPPPPDATTVEPIFYKGGAMVLPGAFGAEQDAPPASLLMNTSMSYPLALDEAGWESAGQSPADFLSVPGQEDLKHGTVPMLRLGAFEITQIPGVLGAPISAIEKEAGAELDGAAGSGLFANLRLTFADQGRTLWMEDLPAEVLALRRQVIEAARRRQLGAAAAVVDPAPESGAASGPANVGGAQPGGEGATQ